MKLTRWLGAALLLQCTFLLTSCFNSSDVKIGVIAPEKGSLEEYGYQISSGIKLAYSEIQAQTNLQKKYTLIWEIEDETNLQSIDEAFERLRAQGVSAIIGPASSAGTLRLTALANKHKIVLLSPSASSPEINTDNGDFVYRTYPSDTLEAQAMSNTIYQSIRLQKILMVRAENTFSEGITYEMLKFGRQNSRAIPDRVVKFDADASKVDWVAKVDEIASLKPHGLFLAAYTDELIPLIREIKKRPELSHVFLFTCSAFVAPKAIEELGPEPLENLMITYYAWDPHDNTNPAIQEFSKKFNEAAHVVPSIYGATSYDGLKILVESIENSNHIVAEKITEYMNKTNFMGILGENDFNKGGSVTRIPAVYRIVGGVVVPVTADDLKTMKETVLTDERYDLSDLVINEPPAATPAGGAPTDGAPADGAPTEPAPQQ